MKFNFPSAALKLVALALTTLLSVLLISSIQALAKVNMLPVPPHSIGQFAQLPRATDLLRPNNPPAVDPQLPGALNYPIFPPQAFAAVALGSAPRQENEPADPTNFGDRYAKDIYGQPAHNDPIIVLHETVGSADSAIGYFQTPHENEDDQSSYHALIRRDGTIAYVVQPEKRAFGAGNSVFKGENGPEAVRTNPRYPASVNNFAYHISLESPEDGRGNEPEHSGYTDEQYKSLSWLVSRTSVPDNRITTHRLVDQSGTRFDPRSFDSQKFLRLLHAYPTRNTAQTGNAQPPQG